MVQIAQMNLLRNCTNKTKKTDGITQQESTRIRDADQSRDEDQCQQPNQEMGLPPNTEG